ncbi:MAG: adenine phosphoribosyltransferase [Treponemataceae bacterium]|nr:adenine phosphoribosyltransferase [Treponemataceae bacterium]
MNRAPLKDSDKQIIDAAIRRVPNFPKEGILFYDITGVLVNPQAFDLVLKTMEEYYTGSGIDAIAAVESRGFIFAAPLAQKLGIPLILIRKKGKLPGDTYSCKYDLEYGSAEIEVHKADVQKGQKILVVDDLIATGGTLEATKKLLEQGGAEAVEVFGVIGLPELNYEKVLNPTPVTTLINYMGA